MPLRLLGGALNWPFVPATVNIGSDLQYRSAFAPDDYPSRARSRPSPIPSPAGTIGAFRPLKPDLAAIHVTLADAAGNAIMLGTEWSRFELSRAAKRVVLIADAIVDDGLHPPVSQSRAHPRPRRRGGGLLAVRGLAASLARHVRRATRRT